MFLLQNHEALTADCHSFGDTLNLPPRPISTPLLIFDCQPPSWYKFLSLPSLPLPLKSKMAAIIFVKKILSTPRQNYASSAGQLISRSQVLSLVTMLIISLFFCVCLHVSLMETCLCDWLIACHYQPCCAQRMKILKSITPVQSRNMTDLPLIR